MGLRTILKHLEPVPVSPLKDRVHGRRVTVQVDEQDRLHPRSEVALNLVGIERMGVRVYVAEHRSRPSLHDGRDGRHASVGRDQYLITPFDPERAQSNAQRVRSRANGNRLHVHPVIGRELALELLELGSHEKPAAVEDARHGGVQLRADCLHARRQHVERHLARGGLETHTAAAGRAAGFAQYSTRWAR